MLNLIKKDYLIAKKIWLTNILLAFIVPLFLAFVNRDMQMPASLVLGPVSILLSVILLSTIFEEEEKYPKAAALLTGIGYSREAQVISRYIIMIFSFLYISLVYALESQVVSALDKLSLEDFVFSLLIYTVVFAIYLGATICKGLRAGRIILMLIIFSISLGPTLISELNIHLNLDFLQAWPRASLILVAIALAIFAYCLSLGISLRSYKRKEL